ncbi:MAG: glutamate--cysteine ligase [Bacteroidota bacterium]
MAFALTSTENMNFIPFNGSPEPTLGVEIELQIVNPDTLNLHSGSLAIMDEVGDHPRIKPELTQSTIEVITGICKTPAEARADLETSLKTLYEISDREGFSFVSAGTHPFGRWADQTIYPNERYNHLVERIQWAARRLNIYGIHVHVGVPSGECCIAVSNALTTFLPHLLALSASSPFVDAEDSGLDSCRVKLFEVMPTAGLPYRLANYGEFQRFMNTLINARAIESIREIWWDIRPHPNFGTIEVRVCDAPATLSDCTALAALVQALIVHLTRLYDQGTWLELLRPWIVRENKWRATRFGLDAEIIIDNTGQQSLLRDEITSLVETLTPISKELGSYDELQDVLRIMRDGNSSTQQRKVFADHGTLESVVQSLSDKLRTDVFAPAPLNGH